MPKRKTKICTTPNCAEPAKTCGKCPKHYSYVRRWMAAGPKLALQHAAKLAERRGLIAEFAGIEERGPAEVVEVKDHRRKRAPARYAPQRERRATA